MLVRSQPDIGSNLEWTGFEYTPVNTKAYFMSEPELWPQAELEIKLEKVTDKKSRYEFRVLIGLTSRCNQC